MARHYLSAVDWVKQRNFATLIPAHYYPNMNSEMLSPSKFVRQKPNPYKAVDMFRANPNPVVVLGDPDEMLEGSCSVETMLDMHRKKVPFTIIKDSDLPEILDGVDRYLLSIKMDVELNNSSVIEYAKLVLSWRPLLYKHYFRYMKTHSKARENLHPGGQSATNLFNLLGKVNPNEDIKGADPLQDKASPPYVIDSVNKAETSSAGNIEDYLSTSHGNAPKLENDFDFNFDDFLKGN